MAIDSVRRGVDAVASEGPAGSPRAWRLPSQQAATNTIRRNATFGCTANSWRQSRRVDYRAECRKHATTSMTSVWQLGNIRVRVNLVKPHRLRATRYNDGKLLNADPKGRAIDDWDFHIRFGTYENLGLESLVLGFDPGGGVDCIADRSVVESSRTPNGACDDASGVYPDANLKV